MAHRLTNDPTNRRVRVRVDIYDRKSQNYKPFPNQACVLALESLLEQRAMFRHLTAFLKERPWLKDIRAEDADAASEPATAEAGE